MSSPKLSDTHFFRSPLEPDVPMADLTAMTNDVAGEIAAVWDEVMNTSVFIDGAMVAAFEDDWARYCGTRFAVGVANGTDAIELTLRALGIGPGDEVIVPTNTFAATAEAVVFAGARPRFVDVDPSTLLITPESIEQAITFRTAAVIVVHLFGSMPDMASIRRLTDDRGLALVEDAAQAQGSRIGTKAAGSFGAAGCFSFYPGKNLGAFGDAGAVVTDSEPLADRVRSLGNHGRATRSKTTHTGLGRNSRLDALQAGILSVKLRRLDHWNGARRAHVATYLTSLPGGVSVVRSDVVSCHHQFVVRVPRRDEVRTALADRGIETGIHYPVPCHQLAPFEQFQHEPLPVAERAAQEILSLPLFPHMAPEQVHRVCLELSDVVGGLG